MPYVQSIVLSNPSDQNDIEITDVNTLPPFHSTKFSKKVQNNFLNFTNSFCNYFKTEKKHSHFLLLLGFTATVKHDC